MVLTCGKWLLFLEEWDMDMRGRGIMEQLTCVEVGRVHSFRSISPSAKRQHLE